MGKPKRTLRTQTTLRDNKMRTIFSQILGYLSHRWLITWHFKTRQCNEESMLANCRLPYKLSLQPRTCQGEAPEASAQIGDRIGDRLGPARDWRRCTVAKISPGAYGVTQCDSSQNNTVIHFYFGGDLISVISVQAFLPKSNLYLNFSSGLTDATACTKLPGSLSRYRNVLRTETAKFCFAENCTQPK